MKQLLALWIIIFSQFAFSCQQTDETFDVKANRADVIIIGSVILLDGDSAEFRIEKSLKGSNEVGKTLWISSLKNTCGIAFNLGQRWLILASGDPLVSTAESGSILLRHTASGPNLNENCKLVASLLHVEVCPALQTKCGDTVCAEGVVCQTVKTGCPGAESYSTCASRQCVPIKK